MMYVVEGEFSKNDSVRHLMVSRLYVFVYLSGWTFMFLLSLHSCTRDTEITSTASSDKTLKWYPLVVFRFDLEFFQNKSTSSILLSHIIVFPTEVSQESVALLLHALVLKSTL